MSYKPTSNYVLIQPEEGQDTTKSGVILPKASKETPQTGTVLALGANLNEKGEVVGVEYIVGDTVLFKKWAAVEVAKDLNKLKSPKLLFVKHDEILAIIEEE